MLNFFNLKCVLLDSDFKNKKALTLFCKCLIIRCLSCDPIWIRTKDLQIRNL